MTPQEQIDLLTQQVAQLTAILASQQAAPMIDMGDIETVLGTGGKYVKSHRIDSDGEMVVMRSGSDLRDLLKIGAGLNCEGRKAAIRGVFGLRMTADNYTGACGHTPGDLGYRSFNQSIRNSW